MSIYLSSFIIGFTAAALPGSVQTTLLQSAVLGNSKKIIRFAVGAAVMDGLFLLLAYFGIGTGAYFFMERKALKSVGFLRMFLKIQLALIMMGIVIKIVLRIGLNIKYIMVTPWISV